MAEASNDLAFLATGAYGKPLAKSFGVPLRLANRSPASHLWRSDLNPSGNNCSVKNMAFVPMSIRLSRTRAGARQPRKCLAQASGVQPRSTMAMENSLPRPTAVWKMSGCSPKPPQDHNDFPSNRSQITVIDSDN